jgi:drug/metabolite transporter (DMT)-like permease
MTSSQGLHFKTYVLILLIILFAPLGNVLLSKGMKDVGALAWRSPESLGHIFIQVFSSPYIWLGIGSLLLFFAAYLLVLSWADYSYVQPASATSYGVVAILGHFALKEPISATRWIGVLVICLGVLVVGNTHPRTTEHK